MRIVPMANGRVRLEKHHEGYIGWDEYLKDPGAFGEEPH